MFEEYTQQPKSHFALTLGIAAPLSLAGLWFGLTLAISGLAINGYDSFPVIGLVELKDGPINTVVNNLFGFGYWVCIAIGVTQLLYVIPAFFWARRKGWPDFRKGLIIGASLVLLLNTTCAVYLVSVSKRSIP
jgi:hypothetical protein